LPPIRFERSGFSAWNGEIARGAAKADADADADAATVATVAPPPRKPVLLPLPAARCRFRPGEHAIAILDPAGMTSLVYARGTVALFTAAARAFRVWPRMHFLRCRFFVAKSRAGKSDERPRGAMLEFRWRNAERLPRGFAFAKRGNVLLVVVEDFTSYFLSLIINILPVSRM
jgi:hypothetical protein